MEAEFDNGKAVTAKAESLHRYSGKPLDKRLSAFLG
jgi:hypothetical protein